MTEPHVFGQYDVTDSAHIVKMVGVHINYLNFNTLVCSKAEIQGPCSENINFIAQDHSIQSKMSYERNF